MAEDSSNISQTAEQLHAKKGQAAVRLLRCYDLNMNPRQFNVGQKQYGCIKAHAILKLVRFKPSVLFDSLW